jgi:hypothetical protein
MGVVAALTCRVVAGLWMRSRTAIAAEVGARAAKGGAERAALENVAQVRNGEGSEGFDFLPPALFLLLFGNREGLLKFDAGTTPVPDGVAMNPGLLCGRGHGASAREQG